jgi:hypothetical protein
VSDAIQDSTFSAPAGASLMTHLKSGLAGYHFSQPNRRLRHASDSSGDMYIRRQDSQLQFSDDGKAVAFSIPDSTFADVSYACGTVARDGVVLTAVRNGERVADVSASVRGDYRAYRVTANGIEQLTKEYTSTAIALPCGGVAYSNGGSLVVARLSGREIHKVGRFTWGPPAISCTADSAVIAMTKWKGDDRKLAWTKSGEKLQISRFSYYSYLLTGSTAHYALGRDIHSFDLEHGKSKVVTTRAFTQKLLHAIGVKRDLDVLQVGFGKLSSLDESLVACVNVQDAKSFDWLYHAIILIDSNTGEARVLRKIDDPWHVSTIRSNGSTLCALLERYENMRLVETREIAIGREQDFLDRDWRMLEHPCYPSFGFQFMPGSRCGAGLVPQ